MRTGPIIAGSILLVIGVAAAVGGGTMKSMADYCIDQRCADSGEVFTMGIVGNGIFLGGALASLAGIGLIVAGIVAEPKARTVPVNAPTLRECPNCTAPAPTDSRYCPSCGTAIAPVIMKRA